MDPSLDMGVGMRLQIRVICLNYEILCGKLTRYSEEKILIKTRIPKGDTSKRTDIEISLYKVLHFLQFRLSFVLITEIIVSIPNFSVDFGKSTHSRLTKSGTDPTPTPCQHR